MADVKKFNIEDCFYSRETCEGNDCSESKVCLFNLQYEGKCYPKECENFFLAVQGPQKKKDHAPKTKKVYKEDLCSLEGQSKCRSDRDCRSDQACIEGGDAHYCIPTFCNVK